MTEVGITTLILIIANIFCSVQGLHDRHSFDQYKLTIDRILFQKDYKRLVTSGFFHISWTHLVVNIATLCFFSRGVEMQLGETRFILIYFAGLLGGNLLTLFFHRHHGEYSTAGASGAVTGIIFATVALFPGFEIGFFGIRFPIPGWFYGFLYVLFSIYGIRSKVDNIGHETQLAGGMAGLLIALLIAPAAFSISFLAALAVAIPSVFFIFIIITKPRFILIENKFFEQHKKNLKRERIRQSAKLDHQQEIDLILEKIHQYGIESLTSIEKEKLDYYSKIIR